MMRYHIKGLVTALLLLANLVTNAQLIKPAKIWTADRANTWYNTHKWLNGANYIPATAINQLEMWQADTFDPATIDKELGWAEGIGFNTMRVFLHSLAYQQNPTGFKKRVDQFLVIADKHHIQPMLVFFDDCWDKLPKIGKQPEPKPGVHNSGWVQDPGDPASRDETLFPALEIYVKDVLTTFAHDKRILLWDLYNEPGNKDKLDSSLPLLLHVFKWARNVNPDQPLTAGIWKPSFEKLNTVQIINSDIITYHHYTDPDDHLKMIQLLKTHGRPLICTEYMARPRNSRFANTMPMLKAENVGAINWGFAAGKTNTIYAPSSFLLKTGNPGEWYHDLFNSDGTPYRKDEVELIRKLNGIK